jgi:hypothetical protein
MFFVIQKMKTYASQTSASEKLSFFFQQIKSYFFSPKWKVLVDGKIDVARSARASPALRIGTI